MHYLSRMRPTNTREALRVQPLAMRRQGDLSFSSSSHYVVTCRQQFLPGWFQLGSNAVIIVVVSLCNEHSSQSVVKIADRLPHLWISPESASGEFKCLEPFRQARSIFRDGSIASHLLDKLAGELFKLEEAV